jgi:hypothetical protein
MNLKNYTSEVPASTSLAKIEKYLVEAGASDISKSYDDKKVCSSIRFRIVVNQVPVFFQLSANIEACYKVLKQKVKRPTATNYDKIKEQAERTAWKIISDWVEVQLSMIQLEQAKLLQVFLPYVFNPDTNQTFYDWVQENKNLLEWK